MTDYCKTVEPRLTAYLDKELPNDEHLKIENHLCDCETCNKELCQLQVAASLLKEAYGSYPLPKVDLDLAWKEIETRVDFGPSRWEQFKSLFERPLVWGPAIATVAVALMIFIRLDLYNKPNSPESIALAPVSGITEIDPSRLCRVESVYSSSGNVALMQTAGSGQPLIWIMQETNKEGVKS